MSLFQVPASAAADPVSLAVAAAALVAAAVKRAIAVLAATALALCLGGAPPAVRLFRAEAGCDFGALADCPLPGNLSASYPAPPGAGGVDVAYDLTATGAGARLYLQTAADYASYLASGVALSLADACSPPTFGACRGQVSVDPRGALYVVLERAGGAANVSGWITVAPRAAPTDRALAVGFGVGLCVLALCLGACACVLARRHCGRRGAPPADPNWSPDSAADGEAGG